MSMGSSRKARQGFPTKAEVMAQTPDPAVRQMLVRLEQLGLETAFDRFDAQKAHCGFGLEGTCCRICNMGPCKVTARSPRGVCGADADLIVARNILRWVAAGVASHGARGREVMLTLKAAAEGRVALPIRGEAKARAIARAFGIDDPAKSLPELAGEIADILLEDLSRSVPDVHHTLQALAPPERQAVWKALDILPISAYHEVFEALHRTGTGTDGDWENVMRQLLRCGLAFAWSSVLGSSDRHGHPLWPAAPRPHQPPISARSTRITVNIAIHGHSPVLPMAIVAAADDPELQALASERGATGIRFYGICCSGLSVALPSRRRQPACQCHRRGTGAGHRRARSLDRRCPGCLSGHHGGGALFPHARGDDQRFLPPAGGRAHCVSIIITPTSPRSRRSPAGSCGWRSNSSRGGAPPMSSCRARSDGGRDRLFDREHRGNLRGFAEPAGGCSADGRVRGIVNLVGCNNPKVLYEKTLCDVADALARRRLC
jgi:anaerobic carbon-monoxide dehydrogenase catalytic subunit